MEDDVAKGFENGPNSHTTHFKMKTQRFRGKFSEWYQKTLQGWMKAEVVALLKLAVPACIQLCFAELMLVISLAFVGHITGQTNELDAAALAISIINVSASTVGHGLSSAAETLCSQSYGHKNYKKVGMVLQRGILILFLTMFPIWGLWLNADSVLISLHQPPCVALLTGEYMKIFCIALPFMFLHIVIGKYLEAQSFMKPLVVSGGLSCAIAVIMHAVMIYGLHQKMIGAAIAMVVSHASAVLMILIYIKATELHSLTWVGWNWNALNGWWHYIKLGVPGLLVNCFEWWAGEVCIIVAGVISKTDLALVAIYVNLLVFIFGPQYGLGTAVTVRVGNKIGAGQVTGAKRVSFIGIGCAVVIAVLIAVVLECVAPFIGHVFTEDRDVLDGIPVLIHICAGSVIADAVQITVASVLKGCGRQFISAVINFFCYYIIGIPLGLVLSFVLHMGATGLCIGLACANVVQCIALCIVLLKQDWNKEVHRAKEHAKMEELHDSNSDIMITHDIESPEFNDDPEKLKDIDPSVEDDLVTSQMDEEGNQPLVNGRYNVQQFKLPLLKNNFRFKQLTIKISFFAISFGILIVSIIVMLQYQPGEDYKNALQCQPTASIGKSYSTEISLLPTPVAVADNI